MEIPVLIQWLLAILGGLTSIGYIIEKWPRLVAYFRAPAVLGKDRHPRDYLVGSLMALLCAAIWGASYASLGYLEKSVTTLQINIFLFAFASAFLYLASLISRLWGNEKKVEAALSRPWTSGRAQLLVALNLGNFFLSVAALSYISASQAMALNNFSPVILALALCVRGRLDMSPGIVLSVILVVLGAFLVNSGEGFSLRLGSELTGTLIALLAGGCFAMWTFLMDEVERALPSHWARLRLLAIVFFSSYALAVSVGFFGEQRLELSTQAVAILALNGLRVALVYALFQIAIRRAGPLLPSVVVVLQVPLTFPFDAWWNRASITPQLWLGSFLILLAGIGLLSDEIRRARAPKT